MSTVVAALGDSITAGTPLWDPDPAVRSEIGDALDEQSSWPFWAAQRDPSLEMRNHGVNRETTAQIAARLEEAVADADALIVQGGINDIVGGHSTDAAAANLRGMVARGQQLGLQVLLTELLPCNGFPQAAAAILELNGLIALVGSELSVPVLPFYATLEDSANQQRIRADWTDDGNHPSVAGYRRLGELAFPL